MAITAKKGKPLILNNGEYLLTEPSTLQPFPSEQQTAVDEVTPWIQAQIDCGLFTLVGEQAVEKAEKDAA